MATISGIDKGARLVPSSTQLRNALAYLAITVFALIFLNMYSATATRNLMFREKYTSSQDKLQVVTSSLSGVDMLSEENVRQVIAVLGELNVTRLIVTDASATALYDSSQSMNAEGRTVLFAEVTQALSGQDVFRCKYENGALQSFSAAPVMTRSVVAGSVYIMEYDPTQGGIVASLERTILRGSIVLLAAIFLFAVIFALVSSGRMRTILTSIRLVREGEYSHKIQRHGTDEYAMLANEFNKLTDKLQESEQTERQFVSDASHELKTPLASIKLLSDSILQNDMDAATMREFVADIGNESDRLTRIAQKLLTLSRVEDSQRVTEHEVVDLSETVSRVFKMLVPLADRQEVALSANVARGCTVLTGDDDMYQIIFNLVENGIKYNKPGGSVHVTLKKTQEEVTLEVSDTGMGIPDIALANIFKRFYRVDKARSRQAGGAGLGLSIVHEMVERNLGTIEVRSEEGKGSCFTVVFPYFGVEEVESDA